MNEAIRFQILTPEQQEEVKDIHGWERSASNRPYVIGVALNENNECVSICLLNWYNRGRMCDACIGTCGQGSVIWTREDYRSQGIFSGLFYWTAEQAGITRPYVTFAGGFHDFLAEKYGLAVPKDEVRREFYPGITANGLMKANELAIKVTEIMQR